MWLHWSEYLLARDEFYRWFQKMTVTLEPPVELQLGLKEKQWQLSHAQVLLGNATNQAVLLERLLEEAGSLFHRIGDPSVDEEAQKRMKAEYDAVRAKAQVRPAVPCPPIPRLHPSIGSLSSRPAPTHPPSLQPPPSLLLLLPTCLLTVTKPAWSSPHPIPPTDQHNHPSTCPSVHPSTTPA